ncbi:MAG: hypothetical protein JF599_04225 [Verrucomicrobia bacterium]|nr:hypothetical protein [Verrucomicrobiota bacterium]
MKFLKYTLAAVLGAAVASLATCQFVSRLAEATTAPAAAPRRSTPRVPDTVKAELVRVSQENAELKAQLDAARASLVEHAATLKQTKEQLDELRRPMTADILSSTLRAELKSGEVVVTGGYKLADGRRLYAFAKPVVQQNNGRDEVMIEGRYLTLTDEAGKSVGLDTLATNAANTLQHGEVWVPEEEQSVVNQLRTTPGTEFLGYPRITVLPGSSGTIEIGDIQLKVTPTLSATHALSLELRLEQPLQDPPAPVAKP